MKTELNDSRMKKAIFLWHPFQSKPFRQLGDLVEVLDKGSFDKGNINIELPDAVREYGSIDVYYGRFEEFFEQDLDGSISMKPNMKFLKGDRYKHGEVVGHIFVDKLKEKE